jgi:N-formylmaleamate deformylase
MLRSLARAAAGASLLAAAAQAQTAAPASPAPATAVVAVAPDPAAPPFTVRREGAGRPMILIPGLMSAGEVWDGTVERFRGRYDVHVLTLAGFGGAAPTGADPFLRTERDAIIRYIRENRLEKPVIVGHSLGGFLAFWIAATAPDLVGPVVAVDGVPYLMALGDTTMTPDKARPQAQAAAAIYASFSPRQVEMQTRMGMRALANDSATWELGARWAGASDPATAGRAIAEMMTTDIRADVAAIRSPVLLMMAGAGTPEQRARGLASYRAQIARVPDGRVVAAENARHFIMRDDPAFFAAELAAFLEGR